MYCLVKAAAKSGTEEQMKKEKSCRAAIEGNIMGRGELAISCFLLKYVSRTVFGMEEIEGGGR